MNDNNTNISSNWAGFHRLWVIIAVILFILLLLLWLLGYGPGGSKCEVPSTVVEKQKLVDNPALLNRIGLLEKENAQIEGLNKRIAEFEKESGLVSGLQAKIKALEALDLNFTTKTVDNSQLLSKIKTLEVQNRAIPTLRNRIAELENAKANVAKTSMPVMALPEVGKLYFLVGSSEFPTDVNQSMVSIIAYLRTNSQSSVTLAGYHDASGNNPDWNRRLALKRSNRVKKILLDAGITRDRIRIEKPSRTVGSGVPKEARRVEIRVSN